MLFIKVFNSQTLWTQDTEDVQKRFPVRGGTGHKSAFKKGSQEPSTFPLLWSSFIPKEILRDVETCLPVNIFHSVQNFVLEEKAEARQTLSHEFVSSADFVGEGRKLTCKT